MNYYNEIKSKLLNNEVYKKVKDYFKNRSDLNTYYEVGKLLIEAQGGEKRAKYGDDLIKEYSKRLSQELNKRFSMTLLRNIRQFYLLFEKYPTLSDKLSWSHYVEVLWLDNINKINYYINISIKYNLSVRQLREKIKNREYDRLNEETKKKLTENKQTEISDFIKNPILIKNIKKDSEISEKILQQLILEDIESFMGELGDGFCFIGSQYRIKIGDRYNYIDLLLFNIKYNCYVVIELKVTELKKEHIGQILTYMHYIDRNVKNIYQEKTIGIIIVKKDNHFIMEYCSDERIYKTTYSLC